MRHALPALTILVLAGAVALAVSLLFHAPSAEDDRATAEQALPSEEVPEAAPESATLVPGLEASPRRTAEPMERSAAPDEPVRAPLPRPGVVRVPIRDGVTGLPLAGATVRFLGARRFAELTSDQAGMVECRLTPDRYRIGAHLDAYERVESGPVDVATLDEQELPGILLFPGASRIEGQLMAQGVRLDRPYLVELRGTGRNPCPECRPRFRPAREATAEAPAQTGRPLRHGTERLSQGAVEVRGANTLQRATLSWQGGEPPTDPSPEPAAQGTSAEGTGNRESPTANASLVPGSTCPACGYDEKVSRWEVWPGGTFAFDHLTSGTYRLLARRDTATAADAEELVEVEPSRRHLVRLVAREFTSMEFELRDSEGGRFDGNWWEQPDPDAEDPTPRLRSAPIQYRFHASERLVATARAAPASRPGRGDPGPRTLSLSFSSFGIAAERDREDRELTEEDQLWPEGGTPGAPSATLPVERLEDSRHRILRLPCRALEFEVKCGPWRSARMPLDLEHAPPTSVLVTLERGEDDPPATAVLQTGGVFEIDGAFLQGLTLDTAVADDG